MSPPRKAELHRKRVRRAKLAKLRQRFKNAKTQQEKTKLLRKAARVSPTAKLA